MDLPPIAMTSSEQARSAACWSTSNLVTFGLRLQDIEARNPHFIMTRRCGMGMEWRRQRLVQNREAVLRSGGERL